MSPSKPKPEVSVATKEGRAQAAKARRMEKLYGNLNVALGDITRAIESGKFFDPVPKKPNRGKDSPPNPALFFKTIGSVTITSDEPLDYHRYDSFKEKIRNEGIQARGQISFAYTNAQGEITERIVELLAIYPVNSPEYLLGYCQLRKEDRTFRVSSIESPIDVQHGHPILDIRRWLSDRKC